MALITCNLYAASLNRTVPIEVIVPSDKVSYPDGALLARAPFKTLYLLHGIHGNYTDWVSQTSIVKYASEHDLVVVMPSGDNKFYADSSTTGDLYATFLTQELIQFCEETFRLSPKREDRFIGGLSMGGFGALVNGLAHPETYSAIAAFSSALEREFFISSDEIPNKVGLTRAVLQSMFGLKDMADFAGSSLDYDWLLEQCAHNADSGVCQRPRLFISCGTEDGLYASNLAFFERTQELGYDSTWYEGPWGHKWEFWDESARLAIEWLGLGEATQGVDSGHIEGELD